MNPSLLEQITEHLSSLPFVSEAVGRERYETERATACSLLTNHLLPGVDRTDDAPLVVTIIGGTNVGKSTIFNHLAGRDLSGVSPLARETKAAVVHGHAESWEAIETGFLPGYARSPLADPSDPARAEPGQSRLFVSTHQEEALRHLLLVDSPDIDGNYTPNHRTALDLLHATDAVIYVASPEKYNDEVCVRFLSLAAGYGRAVWAVANKGMAHEALADLKETVLPAALGSEPLQALIRIERIGDWSDLPKEQLKPIQKGADRRNDLRARALQGSAETVYELGLSLLQRAELEAEGIDILRENLSRLLDDRAEEYADYVRTWVREKRFFELDEVYERVLESFKTPVLDDVYNGVSAAGRWLVGWASGGDTTREKAIENRLAAESIRTGELHQSIFDDVGELATALPSDLVPAARSWLPPPPGAKELREQLDQYLEEVEDFNAAWIAEKTEQEIAHWESHPYKTTFIRGMKTALRYSALGAGIVLTGGIGPHDVFTGPAAEWVVKKLWQFGEEKLYFERIQADFVEGRKELFRNFLERKVEEPIRKRLPDPRPGEMLNALRSDLDRLAKEARL